MDILTARQRSDGQPRSVEVTDGGSVYTSPAAGAVDDVNLAQVGGAAVSLGQKLMTASLPVVLASNQAAVPITGASAYTTPTHTAVNVTVASGAVLAANANRLYALLVNDSDAVIYIKLGAAAVANQGIRLNASGGSYEMSAMLGNLYTGAINGIHAGVGNKALLMTEGT